MLFDAFSEEEMFRTFTSIVTLGSKDNTYKFAWARFLLDYARTHTETKTTRVSFEEIAGYFLQYYWQQICKKKMKHAPQTKKKPKIVTIIEKEFEKPYYPQTFKEIKAQQPEKIKRCIDQIAKICFHDVTWRFQRIGAMRGAPESRLFFEYKILRTINSNRKRVDLKYGIILNSDAIHFFKTYYTVLLKMVILEWSKFLENLNPGLPKLVKKVEGGEGKRKSTKKFRFMLESICSRCFYCKVSLQHVKSAQVEHVIPWDYIEEDELWNLVLVCSQCNCKKLGALPPTESLKSLIKRNKKYSKNIPELEKSLCRLGADFAPLIENHYENAKASGYFPLANNFWNKQTEEQTIYKK